MSEIVTDVLVLEKGELTAEDCFPELITYKVSAGNTFLVSGSAVGRTELLTEVEDQAAQTARDALGVQTKDEAAKTQTRQVLVEQQTKVVDPKTGETISQTTKVTPVTVQKTTETDVDVDVGETKTAPKP